MNVSNLNLAILASDLITIEVKFPATPDKTYKFLASKDDGYAEGKHAVVEAHGRKRGEKMVTGVSNDQLTIVEVVGVDKEPDIDIYRDTIYRFAVMPLNIEQYQNRIDQLEGAANDISKHRRNAAKQQIVQAMLGDDLKAIRGLTFAPVEE